MRIHTDTLTEHDIIGCLPTGVAIVKFTEHGSRIRSHAFEIILSGTSPHRVNSVHHQDDYAATWDEWGIFRRSVYRLDSSLTIPRVYESAEHFAWVTGNRFSGNEGPLARGLTVDTQHRRHKWQYQGTDATGSYSVLECTGRDLTGKDCTAITRHMVRGTFADLDR